ncbi:hypothetical protein BZA05DRAFT_318105, partial [Tricharina praecox]|uniref:uncharacterized protein n=1 Tax=Tricharina praecox TaxID=43433 RepID=UPI00221F962E
IALSTVSTVVVGGVLLIYFLLADFLALPSPLDAIALMAGRLFGPAARERLQNAFATTPRQVVSQVRNRAASIVGRAPPRVGGGGVVGGLWNVGNTCYQNSVLQALASLEGLKSWLDAIEDGITAEALGDLVEELNTVSDRPKVETASALITQASGGTRGWMFNEQQDAQEFLQGLMGVLEKEVGAIEERRKQDTTVGLEGILGRKDYMVAQDTSLRSPFEGLLAQRVGCLKCGYVESISLQPFTTLSLPIPNAWATTLEDCLHGFTEIENIPEVDCDKCTLLSIRDRLIEFRASLSSAPRAPLSPTNSDPESDNEKSPPPQASQAMIETIATRLEAIEEALDDDNFSPRISGVKLDGSLKVSSTKTKQVMIARAPQVLVLHTNRSKFDPLTGTVGKNYAAVRFPAILDLGALGVVTRHEQLSTNPGRAISDSRKEDENVEDDMMAAGGEGVYELQAVVAHYGGHHNGHYVAYRSWADRWWRISDHEVIACHEEDALGASNAFMLFYERVS